MGIKELFDPGRANLTGISNEILFVSEAIHKSRIKVDEEGTTAVAATAVVVNALSLVPTIDFIANRPFIYFIADKDSGMVLFIGDVKQFPQTE